MRRSSRVNYDEIAHLYDSQPYRERTADPELLRFLEQRPVSDPLSVLDIACGTGNQLIANRGVVPYARLVGADGSFGMLRQARAKAAWIILVRADAAALPFASGNFDFIGCQFAFHHFPDKARMLCEAHRVLRPGGRFVLRNMCPQESVDWLYYEYFPEARTIDFKDFWSIETLVTGMEEAGFAKVTVDYEHIRFDQNLSEWLETVRRRDVCSQLQAISEEAYVAGVGRLERDIADTEVSRVRPDHLCLITARGDKVDPV